MFSVSYKYMHEEQKGGFHAMFETYRLYLNIPRPHIGIGKIVVKILACSCKRKFSFAFIL